MKKRHDKGKNKLKLRFSKVNELDEKANKISRSRFYLEIKRNNNWKVNTPKAISGGDINFGPESEWKKPNDEWYTDDADNKRGDVVLDFQEFDKLPINDGCIRGIYSSHVIEYMSIFQQSQSGLFDFEGTYPSEDNEDYRSMYVEAVSKYIQ